MGEINILDLDSYLPIYRVEEEGVLYTSEGKMIVIGTVNSSIEQELLENEETNLQEALQNDNAEGDTSWVDDNKTLGDIGEIIATSYLKKQFTEVEDVSEMTRKGYDIEVLYDNRVIGYEIKTSQSKQGFHITYNELKVATEKQDDYFLFFILEDSIDESYEGYLIQNPIKTFDINFLEIAQLIEHNNVSIFPNRFFVKFNKGYLGSLSKIDLKPYI